MSDADWHGFPKTESLVRSRLAERSSLGVQLWVARNGTVLLDVAVGEARPGVPCTPGTLFNAYCATKPVVACAVLSACERLGAGRQTPVQGPGGLVDVAAIVDHQLNMRRPNIIEFCVSTTERRRQILEDRRADPASWVQGSEYSELLGWLLLCETYQRLTGRGIDEVLETTLACRFDAWPFELFFSLPSGRFDSVAERVGVAVFGDEEIRWPMLHAASRECATIASAWAGGFCSARALGRWYAELVDHLRADASPDDLFPTAQLISEVEGRDAADGELGYVSPYANGFQLDLARHQFGSTVPGTAIGHHGGGGAVFGFADPTSGIAVAGSTGVFSFLADVRAVTLGGLVDCVLEDLDDAGDVQAGS